MATNRGVQNVVKGTLQVGALIVGPAGSVISGLLQIAATLSPVLVAANTIAAQSVTVAGVKVGDFILSVTKPTEQAGLSLVGAARVTADNTVSLNFANDTGAGITPTASQSYTFLVWRP